MKTRYLTPPLLLALLVAGPIACGDDNGFSGPGSFPDVRGPWTGQYSVTRCVVTGASDPTFCDDIFYFGASLAFLLDLDQSGPEVAGDASQGVLSGRLRGDVDDFGVVVLSGTLRGQRLTSEILEWQAVLDGDSLIGAWSFRVQNDTAASLGVATVDADFKLGGPSVLTFNFCPVELDLTQNDQVAGFLGAGDCQRQDDETYIDVFAVDVLPDDSVAITLASDAFSTWLLVADTEGRTLAADGDVGADTAALALKAVVAETWLIVANTFLVNESGDYSLVIEPYSPAANMAVRSVSAPAQRTRGSFSKTSTGQPSLDVRRNPFRAVIEKRD